MALQPYRAIERNPQLVTLFPGVGAACGLDHAWWTREAWLEEISETGPPDKEAA
jgi:hypothetical protein